MIITCLLIGLIIVSLYIFIKQQTIEWFLILIFAAILFVIMCCVQDCLPKNIYTCNIKTYQLLPYDNNQYVIDNGSYYTVRAKNGQEFKLAVVDTLTIYKSDIPQLVIYERKLTKLWYMIFAWIPINDVFWKLYTPL